MEKEQSNQAKTWTWNSKHTEYKIFILNSLYPEDRHCNTEDQIQTCIIYDPEGRFLVVIIEILINIYCMNLLSMS